MDLTQVVIGHSGGTLDTAYHEAVLANGSYLGFDHFGIGTFSLAERVESVRVLCERGHADRIVLSHDAMCHVDWFPPALAGAWKDWRWTHIPEDVLPEMRRAGISEEDITTMMVDNPRRILEGCEPVLSGRRHDEVGGAGAAAHQPPDAECAWHNLADGADLTFAALGHRAPTGLARGLAGSRVWPPRGAGGHRHRSGRTVPLARSPMPRPTGPARWPSRSTPDWPAPELRAHPRPRRAHRRPGRRRSPTPASRGPSWPRRGGLRVLATTGPATGTWTGRRCSHADASPPLPAAR